MVNWMMPWQVAEWLCCGLLAAALAFRVSRRPVLVRLVPFPRELGTVLGLFGLWQLAGRLSVMKVDGAIARGTWIWDAERAIHLPSEAGLQHLVMPHQWLVEAMNLYYASMHFTVMIVFLIWLFLRHREDYPRIRTTLALTTAAALAVQLVPVAPPRMIPKAHLVDTALLYGQSVYGQINPDSPDQLSAMPSVHVAWAVLVGVCVWRLSGSRWRWVGPAHTIATIVVVTATANHYWGDEIVATALVLASVGLQAAARRTAASLRTLAARRKDIRRPQAEPLAAAQSGTKLPIR